MSQNNERISRTKQVASGCVAGKKTKKHMTYLGLRKISARSVAAALLMTGSDASV